MRRRRAGLFFDKQDRDILTLVNHILEAPRLRSDDSLFNPNLHPHGVKELVTSPVSRMAYAVINLLRNLESGGSRSRERLLALQALYDEVLSSAHSALRRNTARVLMQIMKSMVRAHGNMEAQLRLAHDFRAAALGTPRVVRRLLATYHLPEMPEEWNQLAFDDHVYDMNTQGRKTPTHLIMDAWIKGLRTITVLYDNCVEMEAADEIVSAADIVGITVRVGLEFQAPFYGRFVDMLWVPRGFSSGRDFIEFLQSPQMAGLSELGREVLHWRRDRALLTLEIWNDTQRPALAERWGVTVPPASLEGFLDYMGRGHTSLRRLAEYLQLHVRPAMLERMETIRPRAEAGDAEAAAELAELSAFDANDILEHWLSRKEHPELPDLEHPASNPADMPELLRKSPGDLMRELDRIPTGYRMTLCISGLTVEDVTEILWDCEGMISHLEIFNLKGWKEGRLEHLREISELQKVLNCALGPSIKQKLHQMIRRVEQSGDAARLAKFQDMLRHMPRLWEVYSHNPLGTRAGANSSSPMRSYGMGLVVTETLPRRAVAALRQNSQNVRIPLRMAVTEHVTYSEPEYPGALQRFLRSFRRLPGCGRLGMEKQRHWTASSEHSQVCDSGESNVTNLGGLYVAGESASAANDSGDRRGMRYLNSAVSNWLKVFIGFVPAFGSFIYTQDWWVLAYFGTFIWFGITGVRNVVQMVMAARGATRGTLTHWKEHVSVNRICDSLLYTGISVLLLEVMVRVWLLQDGFGVSVERQPGIVFAVINIVNGFYIFAHNIYRGFPRQAAIGNLFRSLLAYPVSLFYNWLLFLLLPLFGIDDPFLYLVPSAAVISKMASDTVAAIIEGYADSQVNMRMRRWDYEGKIKNLFDCATRLEMLFPREDALLQLAHTSGLKGRGGVEAHALERALVVGALDMMYFWFYQPRAQEVLRACVRTMSDVERAVFARTQLVLLREREVSQMLVDGLLGRNFSRPLAFYLDRRKEYLRAVLRLCRAARVREAFVAV